ncbi:MAG: ABC transporter ATP-binding protein [Nocardiopsaceae bacterium]|jgi:NitT/TauT family transport system ATP-binding protein|nr:ABC transporter ATP-binding protein [Nocardiopsaceae bacterium]
MLEITGLTHSYGPAGRARPALRDISLAVAGGELVSIVGPSGCGKSTLLRCVAGLIRPAAGTITLGGSPVERVPDGLAVVFQDYSRSLLPWLTVADNVALPLRRKRGSAPAAAGEADRTAGPARAGRRARREAARAALATVGLTSEGGRYPWQLSGGMQQRVAIARALACDPVLLLMDEPFGSVDAQTREDLEDLVLTVRGQRDITILLVTHDIDESVYVGDRVVVLTPGPGQVRADLRVSLPSPREQITTRQLPAFVQLRAEVGRLVRERETETGAHSERGAAGPVPGTEATAANTGTGQG